MKTLIILAALFIAFLILKSLLRKKRPTTRHSAGSERMLRCDHCGLHIPASEAVLEAGHAYCSEAHRRLSQNQQ